MLNNAPEVLAPAGDTERLGMALEYGADAVYLGRKKFGMRASPLNFNFEQLVSAVQSAHARGVKVYLTCNTLPRNNEIPQFKQFVDEAVSAEVDALIVADIGLLALVKKYAPDMEIHISTQTGILNYVTARELYNMGAKRVVLARELSL
ncbi:MAG: U32 family peptidase, partial [Ruminococcus sp.]|nr:U32 family peptidase [Ruminococcus sp.]